VLWGECRASGGSTGLHTYPDLEVVQVVDPDTGEPVSGPGELVLTQLGMRGSALLRWRTADVVTGIVTGQCPSCRRMVPRIEGLRRAALVAGVGGHVVDLRTVAAALAGRGDLVDWRIVVGHRRRDGAPRVTVHLVSQGGDESAAVIGAATDIRAMAGVLPTQIIAGDERDLAEVYGERLSGRMLIDS
jgi:phenylacetate-coenzyme A ligase PaaK-like adenylate-forming protein